MISRYKRAAREKQILLGALGGGGRWKSRLFKLSELKQLDIRSFGSGFKKFLM